VGEEKAIGALVAILVSVVVPSRNEGTNIRRLIGGLEAQSIDREQFELIIADDGSSDGSTEGIERDGWLRVVHAEGQGPYVARNLGARVARGSFLAFTDADCLPEPSWLERGLAALEDSDLVAGLIRLKQPARRTIWALLDVDLHLDQKRTVREGHATTANLFARRELFERLGGFEERRRSGGDYDFVHRSVASGARLGTAWDAVVWHSPREERRTFLAKIWRINAECARIETIDGRRPPRLRLRSWIPVIETLCGRLRFRRTIGLDRARLSGEGLAPVLAERLIALPLLYLLVPYYANAAQFKGWLVGRRQRRLSVSPTEPDDTPV